MSRRVLQFTAAKTHRLIAFATLTKLRHAHARTVDHNRQSAADGCRTYEENSRGFRYGQEIAIANDKGSLYALANKLPPTGQPATFGEIQGKGILKEPVSGTCFNMKTGQSTFFFFVVAQEVLRKRLHA